MKLQDLIASHEALEARVKELEAKLESMGSNEVRNRGPKSSGEMTLEDAERCMIGDLKDKSHKEAAEALKLSYGQIYSARKGFTFKTTYKKMVEMQKAPKVETPAE